jgi:hypothetical protein
MAGRTLTALRDILRQIPGCGALGVVSAVLELEARGQAGGEDGVSRRGQ